MKICKICTNSGLGVDYQVKEMMFGLRKNFTYFCCESCGCLQIVKIPDDLGAYYKAQDYYSFKAAYKKIKLKLIKKAIVWLKINSYFLSRCICKVSSKFNEYLRWLGPVRGINFDSKILDVGCGSGALLYELKELGFKNLYGVDLYIDSSKNEGPVSILKGGLDDISGEYDLIMLHHSLEHMPYQNEVMQKLNQLLSAKGSLLIRIPLVDCYAWRIYGTSWYQIDAPRHLYLHSSKSLNILAEANNFCLTHSYRDSTELQFSVSEMYARDCASNEIDINLLFKNSKILRKKAAALNSQNDGDQGCFIFKKFTDYSVEKL